MFETGVLSPTAHTDKRLHTHCMHLCLDLTQLCATQHVRWETRTHVSACQTPHKYHLPTNKHPSHADSPPRMHTLLRCTPHTQQPARTITACLHSLVSRVVHTHACHTHTQRHSCDADMCSISDTADASTSTNLLSLRSSSRRAHPSAAFHAHEELHNSSNTL